MAKYSKTKTTVPVKYVGPRYTTGLRPYGFDHDIRPRDFNDATRLQFLEQHPAFAAWWEDSPPPVEVGHLYPVEMPLILEEPQEEEAA